MTSRQKTKGTDGAVVRSLRWRLFRRLLWLGIVSAVAVVWAGLLVIASAALLAVDLAVLLGAFAPSDWVVGVLKVGLSTAAAMVTWYGIFRPLSAMLGAVRFAEVLGVAHGQRFLRAALELGNSSQAGSQSLIEETLSLALKDLRSLSLARVIPSRRLMVALVVFMVMAGGSLLFSMASPVVWKAGLAHLFSPPAAEVRATARVHGETVSSPMVVARPLCGGSMGVLVTPPAYLRASPISARWGGAVQVLEGSSVQVICESAGESGMMLRVETEDTSGLVPFHAPLGEGSDSGVVVASMVAGEDALLGVVGADGRVMDSRQGVVVRPDEAPSVEWTIPLESKEVRPTDTLVISLKVQDDYGLQGVALEYRIPELDPEWSRLDLERPGGRRETVVMREIPVAAMNVEARESVEIRAVAWDQRGDSKGESRNVPIRLGVGSPEGEFEDTIVELSQVRDAAVDLLAGLLELPDGAVIDGLSELVEVVSRQETRLGEVTRRMQAQAHFRGEDVRRLAGLDVALGELSDAVAGLSEKPLAIRRAWLASLKSEVEQQVLVLDGVTEKMLREQLFLMSGRARQEFQSLREVAVDSRGQAGGGRHLVRRLRRLERSAARIVELKRKTEAVLPRALSPDGAGASAGEVDYVLVARKAAALVSRGDGVSLGDWMPMLEDLGAALDAAAGRVEGAYASSMNRLSASFRAAQEELSSRLTRGLRTVGVLKLAMEALLGEVRAETRSTMMRGRALAAVQDAASRLRSVQRLAGRFRSATYLPVDRGMVKEFRERLVLLRDAVSVLRLDYALTLCEELVNSTRSMEFSLLLTIDHARDPKLVDRARNELDKVEEVRRHLSGVSARLASAQPQKRGLRSLGSQRLLELTQELDGVILLAKGVREQVERLQKMFPVFFDGVVPIVDQWEEALGLARALLQDLRLEEASGKLLFAEEIMHRLLSSLESATAGGRGGRTLMAGGVQSDVLLGGKGELASREALEGYVKLGLAVGEIPGWREIIDEYYLVLSH